MRLCETGAAPDWCNTSPSRTNFELCEPEKKNSLLLKTLVPQPNSCGSGLGTLTRVGVADGDVDGDTDGDADGVGDCAGIGAARQLLSNVIFAKATTLALSPKFLFG